MFPLVIQDILRHAIAAHHAVCNRQCRLSGLLSGGGTVDSCQGQAIFITSHPYSEWWLVRVGEKDVGAAYLTIQREVGVLLKQERQGKGYGPRAVKLVIEKVGAPLYANVSPLNAQSIKMFEGLGFVHFQNGYRLEKTLQLQPAL